MSYMEDKFIEIANAIRNKAKHDRPIKATEFAQEIMAIPTVDEEYFNVFVLVVYNFLSETIPRVKIDVTQPGDETASVIVPYPHSDVMMKRIPKNTRVRIYSENKTFHDSYKVHIHGVKGIIDYYETNPYYSNLELFNELITDNVFLKYIITESENDYIEYNYNLQNSTPQWKPFIPGSP